MLGASVVALVTVSPTSGQTLGPAVSVAIVDAPRAQEEWGYAPITREVQAGTWVTWSNDGLETHTVTAVDGSFDSGDLDPSEGFSWYFDQPGAYRYLCAEHPWMAGTIVVGGADGASDAE
jgi:plastocyanin